MNAQTFKTPDYSYNKDNNFQGKSFEGTITEAGYPPVNIINDGRIRRFGKNRKLWYFSLDYYGICGDWSDELPKIEWKGKITLDFKEKLETAKRLFQEEKRKGYERASLKAGKIYNNTYNKPCVSHPYLTKKQIQDFTKHDTEVKVSNSNCLIIPIKNTANEITSLQLIYPNGDKRFLKDGKVKGCFHIIGNLYLEAYICEGYATGLTLHAITKKCVIVCFNAGNIKAVCKNISITHPSIKLTIAGDNDLYGKVNTGKIKAEEAGKEVGLKVILPIFKNPETKPTDFNDLFVLEGVEVVLKTLNKPCLKLLNLKEVMEADIKPKKFILHPILKEGGLAMIYAKRGIGKTFVSLEVAFAVASGGEVFAGKWKVESQRKVLFIDGEMPFETIKERLEGISKRNANTSFDPENLKILNPEQQELGMPDLSTKEGQALMNEYITGDIGLVILDNLSTLCRTGRENESESWLIVQEWILHLRRRNIAVLMIHHAGKNGEQRGNSKKEDILDTVINLKKPNDYDGTEGARFEVIYEKSRNFTGSDAKSFEAVLTENGFVVKDLDIQTETRVFALAKEGMTQRDIARELGLNLTKVNRILKSHEKR